MLEFIYFNRYHLFYALVTCNLQQLLTYKFLINFCHEHMQQC